MARVTQWQSGKEEGTGDEGVGTRVQIRKELQPQIDAIEKIRTASSVSPEFAAWRKETEALLEQVFGVDSLEVQNFNAIYFTPVFLSCRMGDEAFDEAFQKGLGEARVYLQSLMEKIRRPR